MADSFMSRSGEKPNLYEKGDLICGEYEVLATIGKGGFGVVFLARHQSSRTVWALKTFRAEFLADSVAREAFQREALLWVNLEEHPFILAARVVMAFSGRLFVLMDYIEPDSEGRVNLADHLRCGKPVCAERQVEWAIQFCLGMEHAKAQGVRCHRDIKPSNILISAGSVKITDFGLATAAEVALKSGTSQGGPVVQGMPASGLGFSLVRTNGKLRCGTPGYMPPEVYRGETADVRSDIYSFGLVLWQIATGNASPPFVGVFHNDIDAYMHEAYERQMSRSMPTLAGPLGIIVARCLSPAPFYRYSDFGELRGALEPIFQELAGRPFRMPHATEQTAVFWLHKGGSFAALKRHDEAILCYKKALAIEPQMATAWANIGVALDKLNRREEAIACHDKALAIDPKNAATWSNKGVSLDAFGRYEEAIACYDKALIIDPLSAKAWANKGTALHSLTRLEGAIVCYEKTLAIDSQDAITWSNKGISLAALGRPQEAIACFDKALVIDPLRADIWFKKGKLTKRHDEAVRCYDNALAIDSENGEAWNNKGRSLLILGRHEEALFCFDRALAIDPRDAASWNGKGFAAAALGRREEGIISYDKALAIDPRNVDAWKGKGYCLTVLGRPDQAFICFEKVVAIKRLGTDS